MRFKVWQTTYRQGHVIVSRVKWVKQHRERSDRLPEDTETIRRVLEGCSNLLAKEHRHHMAQDKEGETFYEKSL